MGGNQVLPGGRIGVLGGGQLGRMLGQSARQMGYGFLVFGDRPTSPAAAVADRVWPAEFDNQTALAEFAEAVDVVTWEFENIPADAVDFLAEFVPVYPCPQLLRMAQNRRLEKTGLRRLGIPVADFRIVDSEDAVAAALDELNGDMILKTTTDGYDGHGQARVRSSEEAVTAWSRLGQRELIAEQIVDFRLEFSVVGARFADGTTHCFSPFWNHHEDHILDLTVIGSDEIPAPAAQEAAGIVEAVLSEFGTPGLICVEFFLTQDGKVVANEIAPRPHNSGHLTLNACPASQFEQQLRSVCGLPSGEVRASNPAAMANLLGRHLAGADSGAWKAVAAMKDVHVHLYGKAEPRPQRKMGHLTVVADSTDAALARVREARELLQKGLRGQSVGS